MMMITTARITQRTGRIAGQPYNGKLTHAQEKDFASMEKWLRSWLALLFAFLKVHNWGGTFGRLNGLNFARHAVDAH